MNRTQSNANGLKKLVEKCRNEFRMPENTEHHSEEDYRQAEKKYVRFCLTGDPMFSESSANF